MLAIPTFSLSEPLGTRSLAGAASPGTPAHGAADLLAVDDLLPSLGLSPAGEPSAATPNIGELIERARNRARRIEQPWLDINAIPRDSSAHDASRGVPWVGAARGGRRFFGDPDPLSMHVPLPRWREDLGPMPWALTPPRVGVTAVPITRLPTLGSGGATALAVDFPRRIDQPVGYLAMTPALTGSGEPALNPFVVAAAEAARPSAYFLGRGTSAAPLRFASFGLTSLSARRDGRQLGDDVQLAAAQDVRLAWFANSLPDSARRGSEPAAEQATLASAVLPRPLPRLANPVLDSGFAAPELVAAMWSSQDVYTLSTSPSSIEGSMSVRIASRDGSEVSDLVLMGINITSVAFDDEVDAVELADPYAPAAHARTDRADADKTGVATVMAQASSRFTGGPMLWLQSYGQGLLSDGARSFQFELQWAAGTTVIGTGLAAGYLCWQRRRALRIAHV